MHSVRSPLASLARLALVALAAAHLTGCAVEREPNYEFLPWINHMLRSSAAESYAAAPKPADGKPSNLAQGVYANGRAMQLPPAGTIPKLMRVDGQGRQELVPYQPLHQDPAPTGAEAAGVALKSPVEATPENLKRGEWGFATFCVPCHAQNGNGAGLVAQKAGWNFPIGWSDSNAAKMADGHIFHIISYGRNNMPSYAAQINQVDRWKIILHLRELQKQNGPAPTN